MWPCLRGQAVVFEDAHAELPEGNGPAQEGEQG
jgi:hypothetical protein